MYVILLVVPGKGEIVKRCGRHIPVYLGLGIVMLALVVPSVSRAQELLFSKGLAEFNAERYEAALDLFTQANKADPKNATVLYYLGLTQVRVNDLQSALTSFQEVVRVDPTFEKVHYDLGLVLYNLGNYEEALKEFQRAEKQEPDRAMLQYYQGYIYYLTNEFEKSLPYFAKAGELDPGLAQTAYFFSAMAYLKMQQTDKSQEEFQKTVDLDPTSELAVAAKSYLERLAEREVPKKWSLDASISYQYDDNVVLEPSSGSSATRISDDSDNRTVLFVIADYNMVTRPTWGLTARYSLYQSIHETLHDYDIQNHQGGLFYFYRGKVMDTPYRLRLGYKYTNTLLDENRYMESQEIGGTVDLVPGANLLTRLRYRFRDSDYHFSITRPSADRDGINNLVGLSQYFFFAGRKGFLRLAYAFDYDSTTGSNWDYEGHEVNATLHFPFLLRSSMELTTGYYNQDYDNTDTFFLNKREDEEVTYGASIIKEFGKRYMVDLRFTRIENDSNISFYEYDRNIWALTVSASF
jgi:tetratricopeptide (TPR) repeat protein